MKIWIIYDSKFGNNKQIAQDLADQLKQEHDVQVNYAKSISPKKVANESPEAFLFGGPRRAGKISFTIQGWVKKFAKTLHSRKIQLKKVAAWETHGVFKEDDLKSTSKIVQKVTQANLHVGEKWKELVQLFDAEQKVPDILSLTVEGMKGPLEVGAKDKIIQFAEDFNKF